MKNAKDKVKRPASTPGDGGHPHAKTSIRPPIHASIPPDFYIPFPYLVYWFSDALWELFVAASSKAPRDPNLAQWGQSHYGYDGVCLNPARPLLTSVLV